MDGQRQGMPRGKMPVLHARHHVERTIDGQWHNGQLQFVSQSEGTFLERTHVACKRTGTLRKHHHTTVASLQNMTCSLVGMTHLPHPTLVDHNLVRLPAGIAHEGNLVDLVLHHPLEVTTQEAVNQEDVERALMVGHKDIRLVGFQVFAPLDLDRQQEHTRDGSRPPATRVIAPIVTIAQRTSYAHQECSPDGHCNGDGNGNKNLINAI